MSTNDPKLKQAVVTTKLNNQNSRDVELKIMEKPNEEQPIRSPTSGNEQGEKRIRTASDDDYDHNVNEYGTPKRSRSSQRKTRTITNSNYTTTSTLNHNNHSNRVDYPDDQSNNTRSNGNANADGYKFKMTNNAIIFAAEQNLPAIRFECEPKINDQKEGAALLKELSRLIEKNFKNIHPNKKNDVGFETWFIDKRGDLSCFTRDIDLFVFLCDIHHVPTKILQTNVKIILPRHLPPQRSMVIKGVPNSLDIDDVKMIASSKYSSIYSMNEIIGTNNGKSRHLRIDLLNSDEYKQLINASKICIEGQIFNVDEYLAAPRVLFCPNCNEPGHSKKQCQLLFERCRRCGEDRKKDKHVECVIKCHNCSGDHVSTDFKCPAVRCYRRDLIIYLQQHPEALPDNIQLFIPLQLRRKGEKNLSNHVQFSQQASDYPPTKFTSSKGDWPSLNPLIKPNIPYSKIATTDHHESLNDLQKQIAVIENACSKAKEEYDRTNIELKAQITASITRTQSLLTGFLTIIQKQYETISILKNNIKECLEINRLHNQAICFIMSKSDDIQHIEITKQLSSIPFDERISSIDKLFSTYSPLIDEFIMKLIEITKHLNE